MHAVARALAAATAAATAIAGPGATAASAAPVAPTGPGGLVSGVVAQAGGPLYGMVVRAQPATGRCPDGGDCSAQTVSGPGGRYALRGLAPGSYTLQVLDGATPVSLATVTIDGARTRRHVRLVLGAPAVPGGTAAENAGRDLSLLNGERRRNGLPADVRLNPRWSIQCAAHDAYEQANDVLQTTEDPAATGASAGGAWAGLSSVLAQGSWTAAASPWENAPVHLLSLLAPSLGVTGIDDSAGRQCAVTTPGQLRTLAGRDVVHTVPGPGARGVDGSELARESPFAPPQFAGLPADRPTGRELFVYLNRARTAGQAKVEIVSATLTRRGRRLPVRWVDSTTPQLGDYLAGGIVIPVSPLPAASTYRARVVVRDGSHTLTRAWTFTTPAAG